MKKTTIYDIIREYILKGINESESKLCFISSISFETTIPSFGKNHFGIYHLPTSYSRAWREIREKNMYNDLDIELIKQDRINYYIVKLKSGE